MAEITYDYFTMYETGGESFQMWQGRVGPYYLPSVSPEGVLSFTNNGSLPNPAPVNIRGPVGQGIQISGVAETYEELPDDANQGDVWLVGTEYPLEGWVWLGAWMNIGPQGPQGQQGAVFTPEVDEEGNISWTNDGGLPNPETVNIMGPQGEQGVQGETGPAGPGVADGGTSGQVLKKASDDDYDTSWQPLNAGEILYADDGGYASGTVGSEILAAKGDIEDLQEDLAGLDAGDVSYDSSLTYAAGTVGKELGDQKNTLNSKAGQPDLASLNLTGTTNTTGNQIDAGTYFYLNGTLVKAKVDIADGATFTDGTNYEAVTAGGLNSLKNDSGNGYCKMPDGTLIQWGLITISAGSYYNDVPFGINFIDSNYIATVTTAGDNLACSVSASKAINSLRVARAPNTNTTVANWIAIGRWK